MWKAAAGHQVNVGNANGNDDDDWETDPNFVVSRPCCRNFRGAQCQIFRRSLISVILYRFIILNRQPIRQTFGSAIHQANGFNW